MLRALNLSLCGRAEYRPIWSGLCGLSADESVVNCRQRIELSGLPAKLFRLVRVTFPLISLAQAIQIVRVLLVGLLQLAHRFVVVFLLESDHPNQLMSLSRLRWILLGLGSFAKCFGLCFCRGQVFLSQRQSGQ